jgi:hypothetical protein
MHVIALYHRRDGTLTRIHEDDAHLVTLHLEEGVQIKRTGSDEMRFYKDRAVYGVSFATALDEGWCRVVDVAVLRPRADATSENSAYALVADASSDPDDE